MKKHLPVWTCLLVAASLSVVSCKKQDSNQAVKDLEKGKWQITLYQDDGADETAHFVGYAFEFNSDFTVTATNGTITVKGTWTAEYEDNQNKLFLDMGPNAPFNDLNDDWHIKKESNTSIELDDVSGGNGGSEYLTFKRI